MIRRILRQALQYAWEKKNPKPKFFASLVVATLGYSLSEIECEEIVNIINGEEELFLKTLFRDRDLFDLEHFHIDLASGDATQLMAEEERFNRLLDDIADHEAYLSKDKELNKNDGVSSDIGSQLQLPKNTSTEDFSQLKDNGKSKHKMNICDFIQIPRLQPLLL